MTKVEELRKLSEKEMVLHREQLKKELDKEIQNLAPKKERATCWDPYGETPLLEEGLTLEKAIQTFRDKFEEYESLRKMLWTENKRNDCLHLECEIAGKKLEYAERIMNSILRYGEKNPR